MTGAQPSKNRKYSMPVSGLMKGKRGLVMGVANQHSIAWGIAQALHDAGAELAFSYQGDLFKKRVVPLVLNWAASGAAWISWCMPSPFPTRSSSRAAMSTPRPTIFA
jgi:enoyl-ACP reductase-like protein